MSQKRADFILFKSIIELMIKKQHLNMEGFIKILTFKYYLNLGLTEELKKILTYKNQINSKDQINIKYNSNLKKQDLKVAITVKKSIITITETLNPN
jgi:hypothetical protein